MRKESNHILYNGYYIYYKKECDGSHLTNNKTDMNPMDNELQCKRCGRPIKGGCYNAPDGPFCVDCWENKISEKAKKDYEKQALKRLQAIGFGFKTNQ